MTAALIVFIGSGLGGMLRHGVNLAVARLFGLGFPWHTLFVNVTGGFVMGIAAGWLAARAATSWGEPVRLFLATGFLGGYTTFSAFSLDAVVLWERGTPTLAAAYVVASVVLSILGLLAGLAFARIAA
jgi:fluoride exporter